MAFLPAGHVLCDAARLRLADLADEPFVTGDPEKWGTYNAHLLAHCERAGFRPRIVQTAPESRAIVGLVSCGLGVTILSEALVATRDRRVVARPVEGLDARLDSLACWRAADPQPALSRFVEFLATRRSSSAPDDLNVSQRCRRRE